MTVKITRPSIDIRGTLDELNKPSGIAGNAMLAAETPQEQFNLIGAGRKNLIINGAFQVSQRGDYTTAGTLGNGAYFVDRWSAINAAIGATYEHTDVVLPNGINTKAVRVTAGTSASGYGQVRQAIEGHEQFIGQTVTVSAWMRTNKTNTQGFGLTLFVGDWQTKDNTLNDGEWHFISYTLALSASLASNLQTGIQNNNSWVAGEYFEVALFQLELGSVATPFEHRSYGEELALCQRYYEQLGFASTYVTFGVGAGKTSTHMQVVVPYRVQKRGTPSIAFEGSVNQIGGYDSSFHPATAISIQAYGFGFSGNSFGVGLTASGVTAGNAYYVYLDNSSSTGFTIDAEL